jgi:hypothetical protein
MDEEQKRAYEKRQVILKDLFGRNLWEELVEFSYRLLGENIRNYSIGVAPLHGEKRLPVMYLFGKDLCCTVYHDLETGSIKGMIVSREQYNDFLKGQTNYAVPYAGDQDAPSPEDETQEW